MGQTVAPRPVSLRSQPKEAPKKPATLKTGDWRADLLLLLVAIIWGFGFVAQRAGMEHVGPLTYNGLRFLLGGLCLIPFARRESRHRCSDQTLLSRFAGVIAGLVLFGGATLQQWGIQFTTAGKAGFITGIYVVLVPVLGLLWGRRTGGGTWLGAMLSVAGLYLLTGQGNMRVATGDLLVLLGAVFWALHVLVLSVLSPRCPPLRLARDQFFCCAILSLVLALITEEILPAAIARAAGPILFGGLVSVGIGYTLQVVAQQRANPAHAAIILSLETVFAVLGGWLLLDERLGRGALVGCCLMLAGMIVSQVRGDGGKMEDPSRPGR